MSSAVVALDHTAQAVANIRRWRESVPRFARECLRMEPDAWQDGIFAAFNQAPRIALKACVAPGKTAALAVLIWNFLATRPHPRIAATAITWDNLRDNLWAELAKWQARSPFLSRAFTWTQTRIFANDHPETWWASARTWSRSASPEEQGLALAGLHGQHAMAVVDEAGGVPSAVLGAAEGVLANAKPGDEAHLVIAGNPTHLSGPLYDACTKDRGIWHVVEITGDPDRADRAPRVSVDWAREMIRKWGRGSPIVRSRVLGLFPTQPTDALVGLDALEDAYLDPADRKLVPGLRTLGVDVARQGDDRTIVWRRDGEIALGFDEIGGSEGRDIVLISNRVHRIAVEHRADQVRVDDVGVGGGVTDTLKHLEPRPYRVVPVNVGAAPSKKGPDGNDVYANLKAQLSFELAERFRTRRLSLPPEAKETTLQAEATDIRYGAARGGKVYQVESKDDFRKRHNGASPDHWDALMLAFGTLAETNPLAEAEGDDSDPALRVSAINRHGRATGIAGRRMRRSA